MIPTESQEQVALFQWAALAEKEHPCLRWLFAIPNGGLRDKITAARMKREGVKKGCFDICLPVARGGFYGLYIELKRIKGGKVSKEQEEFRQHCLKEGYAAVICNGWEEAKGVIERYLTA